MRSFASRVFRYAVSKARASADPTAALRGALVAPVATHHALKIAPHVFVHPGELRQAEWTKIDLEAGMWKIAASKMKMRQQHLVPL